MAAHLSCTIVVTVTLNAVWAAIEDTSGRYGRAVPVCVVYAVAVETSGGPGGTLTVQPSVVTAEAVTVALQCFIAFVTILCMAVRGLCWWAHIAGINSAVSAILGGTIAVRGFNYF